MTDLTTALLAAVAGGLAARVLRLPIMVGYIVAGIVVGPHTPGFIADEHAVHAVAKIGVALLMFAVGVQFRLEELLPVRRIALAGGGVQILGTILLGWLVGLLLGWGNFGGIFLGCALALSSTAVMMRLLEQRGELGTAHGTAILGILVVQDFAVVLMMSLLPALALIASHGAGALLDVGLSILRAGLLVTLTLVLAGRGVPALLDRVARVNSRELFLMVVVCVCLAAASLAQLAGLSLEIGAFLAGLVISESDYSHETLSQIGPLRDIFASLFFVSIGMLLDPRVLLEQGAAVAALVVLIVLAKPAITVAMVFLLGAHGRTALLTGLGLGQIGEFSFVLASVGAERGLIPDTESAVILAAALVTILLTPALFGAGVPLYTLLNRHPGLSRLLNRHRSAESAHREHSSPRVAILGCGRVGKHVSQALSARGIEHVVVDYDATVVARLRGAGIPVVYGDAGSEVVLSRAIGPSVELAVVALPEASLTPMTVRLLKRLKPDLPVIARVHRGVFLAKARAAGADDVVHAEFEAATAIIRLGLARLGVGEGEVEPYLHSIRSHRYRRE